MPATFNVNCKKCIASNNKDDYQPTLQSTSNNDCKKKAPLTGTHD